MKLPEFGSLSGNPAQACIRNIERIVAARGGVISEPQRHLVAHCLRMPGASTTLPVRRVGDAASGGQDSGRVSA